MEQRIKEFLRAKDVVRIGKFYYVSFERDIEPEHIYTTYKYAVKIDGDNISINDDTIINASPVGFKSQQRVIFFVDENQKELAEKYSETGTFKKFKPRATYYTFEAAALDNAVNKLWN